MQAGEQRAAWQQRARGGPSPLRGLPEALLGGVGPSGASQGKRWAVFADEAWQVVQAQSVHRVDCSYITTCCVS